MFSRTRKKIVLAILGMTSLFLMITLTAIYATSCLSLQKQSDEMLERYVSSYNPDDEPLKVQPGDMSGDLPGDIPSAGRPGEDAHPDDGTLYLQSSFYSAAFTQDMEIISVDTGWNMSRTYEEVVSLAKSILDKGKSKGHFEHMLYRVEQRDGYTLVAFMDDLLMEESMRKVLLHTLIVGAISVILFFAASVVLAGRIVRPLEENDRRQRQFVSDAGHELKTPVTVISTNAELLSRQVGENRWLSNIQYENERMGSLVTELLMLSHAEGGESIAEEVDFSKLTQQEILAFESVAFEHGLALISRIADGIVVKGNRNQLGQIVSILTDNAISYGGSGKEIIVSLQKVHRRAVLTVENMGEIPESDMERLFDRFYRGDEAREASEGHFGLGLPIAKAIAEAHFGEIKASCEKGKVIFTVTLPAK